MVDWLGIRGEKRNCGRFGLSWGIRLRVDDCLGEAGVLGFRVFGGLWDFGFSRDTRR